MCCGQRSNSLKRSSPLLSLTTHTSAGRTQVQCPTSARRVPRAPLQLTATPTRHLLCLTISSFLLLLPPPTTATASLPSPRPNAPVLPTPEQLLLTLLMPCRTRLEAATLPLLKRRSSGDTMLCWCLPKATGSRCRSGCVNTGCMRAIVWEIAVVQLATASSCLPPTFQYWMNWHRSTLRP